jgi:hypothetical protein
MKRERREIERAKKAIVPWTPFEQVTTVVQNGREVVLKDNVLCYINSRYQVIIRKLPPQEGWPEIAHLSIKRNDNQAVHDWRDLQRIKNELIGAEYEGVELYPAESRLVDTANQYFMYVMIDPKFRLPFGFQERLVAEVAHSGCNQRPFEPDARPTDLTLIMPEQFEKGLKNFVGD